MPNVTCNRCGSVFCVPAYRVEKAKYCSRECKSGDQESRFWEKVSVDPETGCWVWQGALQGKYYQHENGGYGSVKWNKRVRPAHLVAWELVRGPVPDGLCIDHLCRNTRCVNPDHMEPVTNAENIRRGLIRRPTHCPQGHEYTDENTVYMSKGKGHKPYRACKICRERVQQQNNERRRAKRASQRVSE